MYGMFSEAGNNAVAKIVADAQQLNDVNEGPFERVHNWVMNELETLAEKEGFEEAVDTEVREMVFNAII